MLSEIQREKLTKLFRIWDTDGNGFLELNDWDRLAKKRAQLSSISPDSDEYRSLLTLHHVIWEVLRQNADTNRDDRVSLEEFQAYCDAQYGDVTDVRYASIPDQLRGLFDVLMGSVDRDQDGRITADDYALFLESWGADEAMPGAKARFERLDRDGDGFISVEEVRQFVADHMLSRDPDAPGNVLFG